MTFATRAGPRGFTLLEVMLGLALLAVGLVVLVKSAANSIFNTQQAHMMGVATDLSRAKMYELEEKLIKDGFSDTEQHEEDQPFTDEGWPSIHYSYKIEPVELPSWDQLQKLALDHAGSGAGAGSSGSGSGAGSDEGAATNKFQDSALGGMMSQFSGGFMVGGKGSGSGSGDVGAAMGASFVQGQYQMFQQILKASIRKVSLTVTWQVMGSDRDMKVVAFITDAASMDKVLMGTGAADLDDQTGSGSGSGKQSGLGNGRGSGSQK
jgi:prepilin-type N-terminal cleavage/methylation domain-containing protein